LRTWTLGRFLGRWPGEPTFAAHCPPYLDGYLPLVAETPSGNFLQRTDAAPTRPIEISLAGTSIRLDPGDEATLFLRTFDDVEVQLALHRFSWLPLLGVKADPAWVVAIWGAWANDYAEPNDGWAWHPYTAAERAINILAFARDNGLPGPVDKTLSVLAVHGPAIAARLEYFGDHHTSNHLANNGRGLFLLGLTLGLPRCTELGGRILIEEAKRIFAPSGILREGSSHYHALLALNYEQCAQAAEKAGRSELAALSNVARRAREVLGCLTLPGGLPLIGDISPDLSPEDVLKNVEVLENGKIDALAPDGWHRFDRGPWSGLWHASPDGFSQMPGHGHQDCGGFELHFGDEVIFVDPGRGTYGETGDAAIYRSGRVHNTVLIDDADPYPPNKPYYDETFRRYMGGPAPRIVQDQQSISLTHDGFRRLKGVGTVHRHWHFTPTLMTIKDSAEGRGSHHISRILVTPLTVSRNEDGVILHGQKQTFRLISDGDVTIDSITRWTAYGRGIPATAIQITNGVCLPWSGTLTLEVI